MLRDSLDPIESKVALIFNQIAFCGDNVIRLSPGDTAEVNQDTFVARSSVLGKRIDLFVPSENDQRLFLRVAHTRLHGEEFTLYRLLTWHPDFVRIPPLQLPCKVQPPRNPFPVFKQELERKFERSFPGDDHEGILQSFKAWDDHRAHMGEFTKAMGKLLALMEEYQTRMVEFKKQQEVYDQEVKELKEAHAQRQENARELHETCKAHYRWVVRRDAKTMFPTYLSTTSSV